MPGVPFWARRRFRGSRGYMPFMIHSRRKSFSVSWSLRRAALRVMNWAPSPVANCNNKYTTLQS